MKPFFVSLLVVCAGTTGLAADRAATALPRSSPEAQGIPSSAILAFVDDADRKIDALHSFMLVRHGHVVAEGWWGPYDAKTRHELYSLSKSFTSTAVGLAIAEGKLSRDDPVLKFFPGDAPAEPGNNLKAMRVRDLLRMATGHQTEPSLRGSVNQPWTRTFLAHPVPFKPGTHFLYNTAGTYMQSAIVQKATGQTVLDYLRPRLFEPLGIEDPTWGTSPQAVSLGGYGLSIRTEDIAKFGQLYLQKGLWNGKQLVPAAWMAEATALQTSNGSNPASDWEQGYGYQFWRCRHGAYRGDGAHGQFCVVMPEQDAVMAITSGVRDMQAVLNLVWDDLLPAMKSGPLPADDAGDKRLRARLAGLTLPTPKRSATAHVPQEVSGKTFSFAANDQKIESVGLKFGPGGDGVTLVARCNGAAEERIGCGLGEWKKGRFAFGRMAPQPTAASGAWTGDNTYTAAVCFNETPYIHTLRLEFADGKVKLDASTNVSLGGARPVRLTGEPGVVAAAAAAPESVKEIPLYPGAAPGSEKWDWAEKTTKDRLGRPVVTDVVRPTLLHFPAEKGKAVGTAMVVAPGGGFRALMMSYEGEDVARRLNALGIDAFVLKYRLTHDGPGAPAAQEVRKLAADDGRRAVKLVREKAGELGYKPDRVGMIGYSAGGIVTYEALFGPAETRPDFAALIYGAGAAKDPPSPAPPLFLAVAGDDALAVTRTVDLFTAYRKGKGLAELHVFQMGAHGFVNKGGGADHYLDRLEEWLAANKLLARAEGAPAR
jgi:CubicO group peptidase (beta-lactamase class C family)/acetyl esterase/lipase